LACTSKLDFKLKNFGATFGIGGWGNCFHRPPSGLTFVGDKKNTCNAIFTQMNTGKADLTQ